MTRLRRHALPLSPPRRLHRADRAARDTEAVLFLDSPNSSWVVRAHEATGRLILQSSGATPFKLDPSAVENLLRLGVVAPDEVTITGNLVVTVPSRRTTSSRRATSSRASKSTRASCGAKNIFPPCPPRVPTRAAPRSPT